MYIDHPVFGLGKVINKLDGFYLIYFFKPNTMLHNGEYGGKPLCGNRHGWWLLKSSVEYYRTEVLGTLRVLIERRQQWESTIE